MYKNIIFDLGGVVVDFKPRDFLLDHFADAEVERMVYDITFGSEEWPLLDAGLITRQRGNEIMMEKARKAGCAFEVQSVLDDWIRSLRPRGRTITIMKRLHQMGFRLFYLSNIPEDALAYLKQKEFFALFEGGIASCQAHVNKPDPRIYQVLMKYYTLSPGETIFVDDVKENVATAFGLEITGIQYRGSNSLIKAFNQCGIGIKAHLLWK